MPIMIFTCGESWRSKEAERQRGIKSKQRSRKGKSKGRSKHSTSQNPQDEILGFDAVAAESSGTAAVAAKPGPAWDAWESGLAAFEPEARLDQWLPANLPIGTANFFQPHETEQQCIDNAMQYFARMGALPTFGEYSPGEFMQYEQDEFMRRYHAFEEAVRAYSVADGQHLFFRPRLSYDI